LQKSFIDLTTAGIAAENLWAEVFPDISLSGGLSYRTTLFTGTPFNTPEAFGYSGSLWLTLKLNPSLRQAMKIIDLAYRSQLLSYENARRQLEIEVTKEFYRLLTERESLANLEEIKTLADRQVEKSQTAFNNGLISQLALLQSRLGAETARLNQSRAETDYRSHLGEFLVLLGLEQYTETVLEGKIEIEQVETDPERLIRDYLGKRPDIVSQRQAIERLELAERQTVLSNRAPTLSLSAQWSGSDPPGTNGFSDTLSGSLSLEIPVESWIPGTKKNQTIGSARAGVEKARLDLRDAENRAMTEIRSLTAKLRNSWGSIEIARLQVEIAQRTYELTDEGFRNGTVEFLDLQEAWNSMAKARQQLLEGELAYQTMMLDLAAALNLDWSALKGGGSARELRNMQ
jgi:multidrug efflux system outer membrane protein